MDELLRHCKHEEPDRWSQWVAVPAYTNVHLEAVETATDTQEETYWTGTSRMGSLWRSIQSERLLEDGEKRCIEPRPYERKTDALGVLWPFQCVPVSARQLLKPPCTERYARWCERTGVNHPLLLDWLYKNYLFKCYLLYNSYVTSEEFYIV